VPAHPPLLLSPLFRHIHIFFLSHTVCQRMSSKRIKSHFIKVSSQDFRPRHKNSNTPRQILRCKGHLPTSSSSKRRTNECAFSNDNYGTSIAATPAETSAAAPISDRSGPLLSVHRRHTRLDGARGYLRYGFG